MSKDLPVMDRAEMALASLSGTAADRRNLELGLLAAAALHALVLYVALPGGPPVLPDPPSPPGRPVPRWLPPPPPPDPPVQPPRREFQAREALIPLPDPTPDAPEPVREAPDPEAPPALPADLTAFTGLPGPPPVPAVLEDIGIPGIAGVSAPVLEFRVEPEYPAAARRAGLTGRVVLQAIVGRDGAVLDVEVVSSTAPGLGFEEAARDAVQRWVYHPARKDGRPLAVYITVVVQFSLN